MPLLLFLFSVKEGSESSNIKVDISNGDGKITKDEKVVLD